MDLTIIIVNYKTFELTKNAVYSILDKNNDFTYEIIIVDNASNDGSLESLNDYFSNEINRNLIKIIANPSNDGFAVANNVAIKESNSDYILLLNSDTVVVDDCLNKSLKYIKENEAIGALGAKVLLENGELDKACKRSFPDIDVSFYRMIGLSKLFPGSKRFGRYNLSYLDENEINEVDALVGAFMLIRREAIQEIGLLDETFFMYGEDLDLCYRIKEAGWKIVYYPESQIIHYKGSSTDKQDKKLIFEFFRAMKIFYNKHYKDKHNFLTNKIVFLGIDFFYHIKLFLNNLK